MLLPKDKSIKALLLLHPRHTTHTLPSHTQVPNYEMKFLIAAMALFAVILADDLPEVDPMLASILLSDSEVGPL